MNRRLSSRSLFRSALAALLLLAMLAGQWTGLEHRVRHAGPGQSLHHLLAGAHYFDYGGHGDDYAHKTGDEGYAHSCQLFDAATLAASIHTGFFLTPCTRAAQDWRLPWPPVPWQAVFSGHFSSRAPPFA